MGYQKQGIPNEHNMWFLDWLLPWKLDSSTSSNKRFFILEEETQHYIDHVREDNKNEIKNINNTTLSINY